MKVTRDLIERYHLNSCSPAERRLVEAWISEDVFEDACDTEMRDSQAIGSEIWASLATDLKTKKPRITLSCFGSSIVRMAFAATALLLATVAATVMIMRWPGTDGTIAGDADVFTIATTPGTRANVGSNKQQSSINFCGVMSIEANRDIEVTLHSTCRDGTTQTATRLLRKGETYIAFNYRFDGGNELMVVNSAAMEDLPPVLRRQFATLF